MPDLRTDQVAANIQLTNYAIDWGDPALIARDLYPVVPVDERGAPYPVYEDESFRIVNSERGQNDTANEMDFPLSEDSYYCKDHALRRFIADQVIKASAKNPGAARALARQNRIKQLKRMVLKEHESAVSTKLTTAGNYNTGLYENLDSAGDRNFDDTSGPGGFAIFQQYLDAGELQCGMRATDLVIVPDAWALIQRDTNFLPSISTEAKITQQGLADLLEIDRVHIARSTYNTAKKTKARSMSRIWGSNLAVGLIVMPGADIESPKTGATFAWNAFNGSVGGETVKTYRDESRGGGGEWVEYSWYYDTKNTGVIVSTAKIISGFYLANLYISL